MIGKRMITDCPADNTKNRRERHNAAVGAADDA
jgi:hypothetical protein